MTIGICDDRQEFRQQLCDCLRETNLLNYSDLIIEYGDGKELLEQKDELDLLFLDIEMPNLSGIELLRKYPQRFEKIKVVLLTSYDDYMMEGYEVGVFRYLKKPVQKDKLRELFRAIDKENILAKRINLRCAGIEHQVVIGNIIYIESCNNRCDVITVNRKLAVYQPLKEFQKILPSQYFTRSHKSFIINWKHVVSLVLENKEVIMSNGDRVCIGIKRLKSFQKEYLDFMAKY